MVLRALKRSARTINAVISVFCIVFCVGVAAANAAPVRLMHWNCHIRDDQTQIDYVARHPVVYHYFRLDHPRRLVIDLSSTQLPDNNRGVRRGCGLVRKVVWDQRKNHVLRFVLFLVKKAPVNVVPSTFARQRFRISLRLGSPKHPQVSTKHSSSQEVSESSAVLHADRDNGPIVIAIDPGHGGIDPGTHGPHGLDEKVVTLAIGKMVARKIDSTPGLHAFLTRHRDRYVSLRERVLEAQDHHAALFVSIHANAYPKAPYVKGGAVYVLSEHGASSAEARMVARAENAADPTIGNVHFATHDPLVNSALTHLMQRASIASGTRLGRDVLHSLSRYEPLYEHHVQYANFEVLRDPVIPSILIETAFLSNPTQARELHTQGFREHLATAIYRGIRRFLENHDMSPVRLVKVKSKRRRTQSFRIRHQHAKKRWSDARKIVYRVKSGDTLSGVALRFHVNQWRLQVYNHLKTTRLRAGENLRIPPPAFKYRVHSGDSLSVIAAEAGVSSHRLKNYNDLQTPRLRIGQVLELPPREESN